MVSLVCAAALAPSVHYLSSPSLLPGSAQLVIVAGGDSDLSWSPGLIASHLLLAPAGRLAPDQLPSCLEAAWPRRGLHPQSPEA